MPARTQSKRRNIMRDFTISEISAVDSPAMENARMSIMKRYTAPDDEKEHEMQKILTRRDDPPISFGSLEEAMAHLQKVHNLSLSDAMSAAAREHPDLVKAYNATGEQQVTKALERMRQPTLPPSVATFEAKVREIAERDMCNGPEAMRRARAEYPREFAEYQSA